MKNRDKIRILDSFYGAISKESSIRLEKAIQRYRKGRLSLAKTAATVNQSYDEFVDILYKKGIRIPVGPTKRNEAKKELKTARTFLK